MNSKSYLINSIFCFGIICILCRPSAAMNQQYRKTQDEIMKQAQQQISDLPQESRHIQRKVLIDTLDKIEQPADRPNSPLRPIKVQIDELLAKEQVRPEEIDSLRKELDKVARENGSGIDHAEYEELKGKLDMAFGFTKTITELQDSYSTTVKKLDNNFEATANEGEKAAFWKNIFSGGFIISFVANLIAFFGLVIKVPDVKLERKLKELLIIEKKTKLQQEGINLQNIA